MLIVRKVAEAIRDTLPDPFTKKSHFQFYVNKHAERSLQNALLLERTQEECSWQLDNG